ncbi:unnamed protein product [Owenia fusiformis]|uniref:non-specific serine/threonine protein kinase n=1 Tax=Owenia fusiformis TaxID=6347 RepID=A0A8S4NNG6_OWEFU|nr:unnamed protein product [Owenia fusiformis]
MATSDNLKLLKQGAEAKLFTGDYFGRPCLIKERFKKTYRHPILDKSLTSQRTKNEVRSMVKCRMLGIETPTVLFVDLEQSRIYMDYLAEAITVRDYIYKVQGDKDMIVKLSPLAKSIGNTLGKMHLNNIIHGDLTTSNMLLKKPFEDLKLVMIDFGLSFIDNSQTEEDKGVDLYVLERALLSTHPNTEALFDVIIQGYKEENQQGAAEVIKKYEEVRMRGRKRTMVG